MKTCTRCVVAVFAIIVLAILAALAGCGDRRPATPHPACARFYGGQGVRMGTLPGVISYVYRYRGEAHVYFQGLPNGMMVACRDLEPLVSPRVEQ